MEERPREWGSAGYELPPETEGWESKIERAKEGSIAHDSPSVDKGPVSAAPAIPTQPVAPSPPTQASPISATPVFSPGITEEELEKQSAERAKQVIASTSDDPYEQKEQLSRLKGEYMKARFNRDIKLKEPV